MVQTMKEYQKEYFEKEGYTIIDNMENAISAFCERYPQHTNVAEESILNDTNCDWVVLNDGSVAVLPGVLEKPVCEVSEYYGDNVFMLVSRVNKALQRAGQHGTAGKLPEVRAKTVRVDRWEKTPTRTAQDKIKIKKTPAGSSLAGVFYFVLT